MIKQLIIVALGGGIGSVIRYLVSLGIPKQSFVTFPWATFIVNITGSLLMGFLFGYFVRLNVLDSQLKLFLITGFCGGYTTFSAFSLESAKLIESNHYWTFAAYVGGSILLGLIAVCIGYFITKSLFH